MPTTHHSPFVDPIPESGDVDTTCGETVDVSNAEFINIDLVDCKPCLEALITTYEADLVTANDQLDILKDRVAAM